MGKCAPKLLNPSNAMAPRTSRCRRRSSCGGTVDDRSADAKTGGCYFSRGSRSVTCIRKASDRCGPTTDTLAHLPSRLPSVNARIERQHDLELMPSKVADGPSLSTSSFAPPTTRSPRLTRVSEGKPLRRLLVTLKAHIVSVDRLHGTPPWWLMVPTCRSRWWSGVGTIHRPSLCEGAAPPPAIGWLAGPLGPSRTDMPCGRRFLRPVRLPISPRGG